MTTGPCKYFFQIAASYAFHKADREGKVKRISLGPLMFYTANFDILEGLKDDPYVCEELGISATSTNKEIAQAIENKENRQVAGFYIAADDDKLIDENDQICFLQIERGENN